MNSKLTLKYQEFITYLRDEKKYSIHTVRAYKIDLKDFSDFIENYHGNINLNKIEKSMIQFYIQKLTKRGLSSRSTSRKLASIKSLFKYLTIYDEVKLNVAHGIRSPKHQKRLPQYLNLTEVNKILELPNKNTFDGIKDSAIIELFYSTGIRISELANIKLDNIRLESKTIKVLGKGNKERIVIFGDPAQKAIKMYLSQRSTHRFSKSDYLFPNERTISKNKPQHISTEKVFKVVKKYLKLVSNESHLSPHSFRHTFATHLLNNGADLMSVKDLLGHASLSSTQIYTHVQIDKMKKIYKQAHPHNE
jgi:integrase/recombinase XerC